jgi:hypothetical protein
MPWWATAGPPAEELRPGMNELQEDRARQFASCESSDSDSARTASREVMGITG